MTYRDKLLFIASSLASGPLSDEQRLDLSRQIGAVAVQVGHIEECLDEQVEAARLNELANHSPLPANVVRLPRVWVEARR